MTLDHLPPLGVTKLMDQPKITTDFSVKGLTEKLQLSESEPCPVCNKALVAHSKEEVFACAKRQAPKDA